MTKLHQVYKCNICGNIAEILHSGAGQLVCCGERMELMSEKSTDAGIEKHLPVTEQKDNGVTVKVGSVPHPMEDNHYIEWIEINVGEKEGKKFLQPGDAPEVEFDIKVSPDSEITARAYCNVHGLWKA